MNSRNKSSLVDAVHTTRLLKKIKDLHAQRASRLVFRVPGARYSAADCANVVIDENAQTVEYDDPEAAPKAYTLADIESIQRIRSRKYLISFKS